MAQENSAKFYELNKELTITKVKLDVAEKKLMKLDYYRAKQTHMERERDLLRSQDKMEIVNYIDT